jgi:hypothetical protein
MHCRNCGVASYRIINVDKKMLNVEALGEAGAERLDAIALCRMVPRSKEGDAAFRGDMGDLLGDFARQIDVGPRIDRGFEIVLRPARTPSDPAQFGVGIAELKRDPAQRLLDLRRKVRERNGHRESSHPSDTVRTETPVADEAEPGAQLRVIANLGVIVKR